MLLIFLSVIGYGFACKLFAHSREYPILMNADGSVRSPAEQQVGLQKKFQDDGDYKVDGEQGLQMKQLKH